MTQNWGNNQDNVPPSRLFAVVVFSSAIMLFWQMFFISPSKESSTQSVKNSSENEAKTVEVPSVSADQYVNNLNILPVMDAVKGNESYYTTLKNDFIELKINQIGSVVDFAILYEYSHSLNSEEPVVLFSPLNTNESKYAMFGWVGGDTAVPDAKTIWKVISSNNSSVVISHKNKDAVEFYIQFTLDNQYMVNITQWVVNKSGKDISLTPYGKIKKDITIPSAETGAFEGVALINKNAVNEVQYAKIKKSGHIEYVNEKSVCKNGQFNWSGISQKYWLSAIVFECDSVSSVNLRYFSANKRDYIQEEVIKDTTFIADKGKSADINSILFLGPKDITSLDKYAAEYNIKLFDKAIDFGMFYFLTKPILLLLRAIYNYVHNYGFAIIMLTILIRIIMLPLGNKSYRMMNKMKKTQPQVELLKKEFEKDKASLNRAMIDLYRKEKINPFSTFVPLLIQIPIFFALYKVLYVSIEIRHSPFIWWINDLSVRDPTSIFNLFGLLPFGVPVMLQVGVLPIIVGGTMWLQQIMGSTGQSNEYTKMMKYMPIFFTFIFASFPSGLMVYWAVNNIFSIMNQYLVSKNS